MPYISQETIDKVFDVANIVEVIGEFVSLKRSGASYKGLSPFVEEKTPSFMVSPAKGIWKDFASGKGGNTPIGFLMQKTAMNYPEAIEYLAKKYSIEVKYDNSEQARLKNEAREKKEALRPLLESAIQQYEKAFAALDDDHPAKIEVYTRRGYTDEIVEQYRIGYAPGDRFIYDKCVQVGRKTDAMEIGLVSDHGDKWRDRVIFPLIERRGSSLLPVGIAGRNIARESKYAKWMNSAESDLFDKSDFLYGLDKAIERIVSCGEVWLVEGYNDVIAWQQQGLLNTVASSGTAITPKHIRKLKKLCDRVIICFDPDRAGIDAMLKYIPQFLNYGFTVNTFQLYPKLDPDDFARYWWGNDWSKKPLADASDKSFRKDGFKFLMEHELSDKDDLEKGKTVKKLTKLIAGIPDEYMVTLYSEWLAKESGIKISNIKTWLKQDEFIKPTDQEYYRIPKNVVIPLEELRPVIEKYQLFQANSQIWIQSGTNPPFDFRSVSNFTIEIVQHMQDEKLPTKLIRVRNIKGDEKIFDIPSSDMNTPQRFEDALTGYGNYFWKGSRGDHQLLKAYLFDQMGTGRRVDVLGWQPEGFWVWNNKVTVPDGQDIDLDDNGVFTKDDVSYYVPSANRIYRQNPYMFEVQKKMISIAPSVTFQEYASNVIAVHREHGMIGLLFAVASIFQDIVVKELGAFPMMFLFGPASSGKDQLAECCKRFFGHPQSAINLEGGVSTQKAQVREFAQFMNIICELSEYKPGDPKLDGILKGLWDRSGYKRGNMNSHVGTESIPILSSVLMTGNYAPDQEALITRYMWNYMDKTTFTDEEVRRYDRLADISKKGVSGFTDDFLRHRSRIEKDFKSKYREFRATLNCRNQTANGRMLTNLSVLGTFYQLFQNTVSFPFSHEVMMNHFAKMITFQMNKMESASIINRFWNCFLASMRGSLADQIRVGRDFKLEGDALYFNFTSCFNRVQRQWFTQYRDNSPGKAVMMDAIKKDNSFEDIYKAVRMGSGRTAATTSAYKVKVSLLPVTDELRHAVDFQLNESPFGSSLSPATPEIFEKNNNKRDELPF